MPRSLSFTRFAVFSLGFYLATVRLPATEVVHVFVALADNASQGIVPVPAKIGDGDKPSDNLYWGCTEGVRAWFGSSKRWKKIATPSPPRAEILERVIFKHVEKDMWLVADAWRGKEIRTCLGEFAKACSGSSAEEIKVGDTVLRGGGGAALVAYIGHNGLMDFTMAWPTALKDNKNRKPAIVLCCMSQDYFSTPLKNLGTQPLLTTRQLMYPGAFVLHDALEAWLSAKKPEDIRDAAARAYAKNQRISVKAALGVFAAE